MNIHKSKIEWCSHTWNPVTGCKHGCEYCYARRMVSRFGPHPCERPGIEPLEVLPKGTGCYYVEKPTQLYDETGELARSTPYPKGFAPHLPRLYHGLPGEAERACADFRLQHGRPVRGVGAGHLD